MGGLVGFRSIVVTIATAGTAVPITTERIHTTWFELHVPSGNTGSVFIGDKTVDDTWIGRNKASGADDEDGTYLFTIEGSNLASGDYFDLSQVYLDADTSGDTAIVQYVRAES